MSSDTGVRLAALLGGLGHALDLTEGQPAGHCVRCCWIGTHIGRQIGLDDKALSDLYYTLLLKDLGCSSNAARICELYLTDDLSFKRDFKLYDGSLPQALWFLLENTGLKAGMLTRLRTLIHVAQHGAKISQETIETRCQRGAEIARKMRFNQSVAAGIQSLDEHWNGSGKPSGLIGEAIPLPSRIALMAQVVDVFNMSNGAMAAIAEIKSRSGTWFDPHLVQAFEQVASNSDFWAQLGSQTLDQEIYALEPATMTINVDEDYLDDIAAAFAEVIDSKSPFTSGHSDRVTLYTDMIARELGVPSERRRWLRRAALLHDIGKLGVSNTILDKPGKLDGEEWKAMQKHAEYSESILARTAIFADLAPIAGAHHEKLDGSGYPKGFSGEQIPFEARIITVADIFDALTADRPYRAAMPADKAFKIMRETMAGEIDLGCLDALHTAVSRLEVIAA